MMQRIKFFLFWVTFILMQFAFSSSYEKIARIAYNNYDNDPDGYKQKEKSKIFESWTVTFRPLIQNGALDEKQMKEIIDAGVNDWEPPEEQDHSHYLPV